jgi:hypothetical protein
VLAALGVGADFVLRWAAQNQVADDLQKSLKLSQRPEVSLGGFPFVVHLVEGRFASATASASELEQGGVTLRDVSLTLSQLRFSAGDILARRKSTVRADSGNGSATMSGDDVTVALRQVRSDLTVTIDHGTLQVGAVGIPETVTATPTLSGRTLTLRSTDRRLRLKISIELPEFIKGLEFTGLRLDGDTAVLSFRLDHPEFDVPGS